MGIIKGKKSKNEPVKDAPDNELVEMTDEFNDDFSLDGDFEISDEFADIVDDLDFDKSEPKEETDDFTGDVEDFGALLDVEDDLDELDTTDSSESIAETENEFDNLSDFDLDDALSGENDENNAEIGENEPILTSESDTSAQNQEDTSEKGEKCPNCGEKLQPDSTFCANCGTALKELSEFESTTPLASKAMTPRLVRMDAVDFSDAISGDKNIIIKTENGYKALTKVDEIVAYPIDCDENMAKVLVSDHVLRTCEPDLDTKITVYTFLKEHGETLVELYGTDNLNSIYQEDADAILEFANLDKTLLSLPLSSEILRIFAKAKKKDQKVIGECIKDFYDSYMSGEDELIISKPTALEITMDVNPDNIRKTLAEEARIYFILKGLM